jgi:spore germination protein KA
MHIQPWKKVEQVSSSSAESGSEEESEENKKPKVSKEAYSETTLLGIRISSSLAENIEMVNKVVGGNADLVTRNFSLGRTETVASVIFYIDNMIDSKHIDFNIMQPLLTDCYATGLSRGPEVIAEIGSGNLITRAQMKKSKNMKELMDGLLVGEAVLLIEGIDEAHIISSKGYDYRAVTESNVEPVVKGPRDAFIEALSINIGLIRRRIHSPNLVFESLKVGKVTQTTVCISYIKGICSPELVNEVQSRINKINIDGVLASNYIEEFINDEPFSLFPQIRNTERPDVSCAALLEGRVVVIIDNTPVALIIPGELFSLLQSAEDYYNGYIFSSLIRFLRYFSFAVALTLPAFYIAVANFHQELIPTELLRTIISSRTGVPLPNFVEAVLMEFTFEILREAGVRLPKTVGQAVSIVGALVIGQSAVQASLVSPLMVIVVSLTGIATFTIPQYDISHPVRIVRFLLMILASMLGLYGLMLGLLVMLLHLCSIRSFGIPYIAPLKVSDLKDTLIRLPWWSLITRPTETSQNRRRMSSRQIIKPPGNGRNTP